jgi:hypothetical protein
MTLGRKISPIAIRGATRAIASSSVGGAILPSLASQRRPSRQPATARQPVRLVNLARRGSAADPR